MRLSSGCFFGVRRKCSLNQIKAVDNTKKCQLGEKLNNAFSDELFFMGIFFLINFFYSLMFRKYPSKSHHHPPHDLY